MENEKAVLISIQPQWCELIAAGKKTVEVRKTKPKLETPFKVYIYCTLSGSNELFKNVLHGDVAAWNRGKWGLRKGNVIGEFVCDKIFDICIEISSPDDLPGYPFPGTGLTDKEILQYLGNGNTGYGWHISDLKIYDKPKNLSHLSCVCKHYDADSDSFCCGCDYFYVESNESVGYYSECLVDGYIPVKKPPQSWCYVERRTDND